MTTTETPEAPIRTYKLIVDVNDTEFSRINENINTLIRELLSGNWDQVSLEFKGLNNPLLWFLPQSRTCMRNYWNLGLGGVLDYFGWREGLCGMVWCIGYGTWTIRPEGEITIDRSPESENYKTYSRLLDCEKMATRARVEAMVSLLNPSQEVPVNTPLTNNSVMTDSLVSTVDTMTSQLQNSTFRENTPTEGRSPSESYVSIPSSSTSCSLQECETCTSRS